MRPTGAFSVPLMVLSVGRSAVVVLVVPRRARAAVGMRRFAAAPAVAGTAPAALTYAQALLATRAAFGRSEDHRTARGPVPFEDLVPGAPWPGVTAMPPAPGGVVPVVEGARCRGAQYHAVERRPGGHTAIVPPPPPGRWRPGRLRAESADPAGRPRGAAPGVPDGARPGRVPGADRIGPACAAAQAARGSCNLPLLCGVVNRL